MGERMSSARSSKFREDRLQNSKPGEPVDLWIYSSFQKDHWVARKGEEWTRAELFAGPIYWTGESFYRLYRSKTQGQPAGSLVGFVLRIFIRPPQ